LTLDTCAYYLLTNTQNNAVLLFPNLNNMTIDLAGSTMYFNGPLVLPLQLYYCSNVTLTNFQIDFVHPPYTHVQLTSVGIQPSFEVPDAAQMAGSRLI
jgi:hypothetical protein